KRKVRGGAWPPVAHLVHRAVVDRGPAGIRPPDPPSGAGASGTQARPPPDAPSAPARAAPAPDPARPQAPPPSLPTPGSPRSVPPSPDPRRGPGPAASATSGSSGSPAH